jgi:type II secretory pathway component HofQ
VGIRDENQEAKRPQALHLTNQQNNNQSQRGQSETLQMQMRAWELQKLKQAKIQYFTRLRAASMMAAANVSLHVLAWRILQSLPQHAT